MSPAGKKPASRRKKKSSAAKPAAAPLRDPTAGIDDLGRAHEEIIRLSSLIEASQTINSSLDLDAMLPRILKTATVNVKADRGTLFLVDRERNEIWSKVMQGDELTEIRLPVGHGLSGYVAQTGEDILIEDAYQDPRFNPDTDKATGYRTRSVLTTPMRNKNGEIIGVFQLLNKATGPFDQGDVDFLNALSAHAAIAIENAFLLQESLAKQAMEQELEVARGIQQRLLPVESPWVEGYELIGLNTPCEAVGGDNYDFIQLEGGRWMIVIGDVVGHGVPAALLMANLYASMRSHAQYEVDLGTVIARVNDFIHRSTDVLQYATLFVGVLEPKTGTFTFTNAGHPPPYLVRCPDPGTGEPAIETMKEGGIPVGMMPGVPYETGSVIMNPGDFVFLFTDGVTEAMNEAGDMLEEQRLEACLKSCAGLDLNNIVHEVQVEIRAFAGEAPQEDDVTMVAMRRHH